VAHSELPAVRNDDGQRWLMVLRLDDGDIVDLGEDRAAIDNGAKDDVLAVQPLARAEGDEKLRAVGVGATVGHGEHKRARVLECKVLVVKHRAIDREATGAVVVLNVATLRHEAIDHAEKAGVLIAGRNVILLELARAELTEVLRRSWAAVRKELHDHAPGLDAANRNVEEHDRVINIGLVRVRTGQTLL